MTLQLKSTMHEMSEFEVFPIKSKSMNEIANESKINARDSSEKDELLDKPPECIETQLSNLSLCKGIGKERKRKMVSSEYPNDQQMEYATYTEQVKKQRLESSGEILVQQSAQNQEKLKSPAIQNEISTVNKVISNTEKQESKAISEERSENSFIEAYQAIKKDLDKTFTSMISRLEIKTKQCETEFEKIENNSVMKKQEAGLKINQTCEPFSQTKDSLTSGLKDVKSISPQSKEIEQSIFSGLEDKKYVSSGLKDEEYISPRLKEQVKETVSLSLIGDSKSPDILQEGVEQIGLFGNQNMKNSQRAKILRQDCTGFGESIDDLTCRQMKSFVKELLFEEAHEGYPIDQIKELIPKEADEEYPIDQLIYPPVDTNIKIGTPIYFENNPKQIGNLKPSIEAAAQEYKEFKKKFHSQKKINVPREKEEISAATVESQKEISSSDTTSTLQKKFQNKSFPSAATSETEINTSESTFEKFHMQNSEKVQETDQQGISSSKRTTSLEKDLLYFYKKTYKMEKKRKKMCKEALKKLHR